MYIEKKENLSELLAEQTIRQNNLEELIEERKKLARNFDNNNHIISPSISTHLPGDEKTAELFISNIMAPLVMVQNRINMEREFLKRIEEKISKLSSSSFTKHQ